MAGIGFPLFLLGTLVLFALPRLANVEARALLVTGHRVGLRQMAITDWSDVEAVNSASNLNASGAVRSNSTEPRPGLLEFGVCDLASDRIVAIVSFWPAEREHEPLPALELGIMVREDQQRRGIGTEATALAVGFMLDAGCRRVIAGCSKDNLAMRSILEKLAGYPYHEGPLTLPDGQHVTARWFAFDDEDQQGPEAGTSADSG